MHENLTYVLEAHFVNYFPVKMEESYSAAEIQTLE